MKIELKKIEHMDRNSEETACYVAQVWVDGKHMVDVSNDGHGGCDHQNGANGYTWKDIENLNARIAAEYPSPFTIEGKPVPSDLEIVCGDLLTEHLFAKDLKRAMSRKMLFVSPKNDGIRCVGFKASRLPTKTALFSEWMGKYPKDTILNCLPFDKALAIYRANG